MKLENIPTSEFSLSSKFLDEILYSIKNGQTVQFYTGWLFENNYKTTLKVKNKSLLCTMPLNQYNNLVKQLDSRKKYLKNQGLL